MEKSQSEVTNKIRSAIKKKLAEISEFADDDNLPEYIMILIANQRSKPQVEKDLSLFLGNDTTNFTNWLWDLVKNLNVGSKSGRSSTSKSNSSVPKTIEVENDEDAVVLDFDPDERETEFLSHEDTNDSFKSKSSIQTSSVQVKEETPEIIVEKSVNHKCIEKGKSNSKVLAKNRKKSVNHFSKEPLSSAVIPVRKKSANSEDEYDPAKPEYEKASFSSSSRKYGGPAALQANKLLLKAVDDATKSITKGKSVEDFYKPTPIKVLTSKPYRNPQPDIDSLENNSTFFETISQSQAPSNFSDESEFLDSQYSSNVLINDEQFDYLRASPKNRTICIKPKSLVSNNSVYEIDTESVEPFPYLETPEEESPKSPHFIVTLDGINRTSFKRKFEDDSVESMEEDEDENISNEDVGESSEKRSKLNERCKYWPACKNSDHCVYHHPTVPCKCFPDCKFGDKCLYIHPNCKFDALCSRKDCPFTHASKRKLPLAPVPVRVPVKVRKVKPVCKFYPKCTSKHCPFIHPKLCRYGTACRLPACLFSHFSVPSRSQLRWQAAIL